MRFIYTVLLGMVVFQGFMVLLAPIFPSGATSSSEYGIDAENLSTDPSSDYNTVSKKYKDVGTIGTIIMGMFFNPVTLAIVAVFVSLSAGIGAVFGGAKNIPLAVGIGIVLGIVASIWNGTYKLISGLAQSNIYVEGIFTLITVCIGIILIFLIAEFFMGQTQGVN